MIWLYWYNDRIYEKLVGYENNVIMSIILINFFYTAVWNIRDFNYKSIYIYILQCLEIMYKFFENFLKTCLLFLGIIKNT